MKLRINKEIYESTENAADTVKKRRVTFDEHIKRMNGDRLTKNNFDYFDKSSKKQMNEIKEIRRDMEHMGWPQTDILNRSVFGKRVKSFGDFSETKKENNRRGAVE